MNGSALREDILTDLVEVVVERGVHLTGAFTLRFDDPDFLLVDATTFAIGTEVEISFDSVVAITGMVQSLGSEQTSNSRHEFVVGGHDVSYRLGHGTKVRTFLSQSYQDVVTAIAREAGLRVEIDSELSVVKLPYIVQSTTNHQFLSQLARRMGASWSVDAQTLRFSAVRQGEATATLEFGENLRRFRARYSGVEHADKVTVRGWDAVNQRAILATEPLRNHAATRTAATIGTSRQDSEPGELRTSGAVVESLDEARQLATAMADRVAGAEFSARGEAVDCPELAAGKWVDVGGVGTRMGGTYFVTSVEHRWGRGVALSTRFEVGGSEKDTLVELLGPGSADVARLGEGLTVGVVTNNNDPDGLGRIKVKFPSVDDQIESAWARLVVPGGGSNRGFGILPELDDEVLVAFEHGDLRRPFVLGGLWGGRAKPPTTSAGILDRGKVHTWGLTTRSGQQLRLKQGDQPADQHFVVQLVDGTKIYLGQDKVEVVSGGGKTIELKSNSASVLLDGSTGDITLKGRNITLDATTKVTVKGAMIEQAAQSSFKAQASGVMELKASGPCKLESSAVTEVKGTLVKIN